MHELIKYHTYTVFLRASLVAQSVKNLPAVQETVIQALSWEDPLEKEMANDSSILAWKISWTAPGAVRARAPRWPTLCGHLCGECHQLGFRARLPGLPVACGLSSLFNLRVALLLSGGEQKCFSPGDFVRMRGCRLGERGVQPLQRVSCCY